MALFKVEMRWLKPRYEEENDVLDVGSVLENIRMSAIRDQTGFQTHLYAHPRRCRILGYEMQDQFADMLS